MAEFLLDELQCVQLVAKEQHRRKRRLEKLNKIKRHKFLKYAQKHTKYHVKRTGFILNIYLEIEYEIYDNKHFEQMDDDIIIKTKKKPKYSSKCKCAQHPHKKQKEKNEKDEISLSKCFESIQHSFSHRTIMNLEFPHKFVYDITSLYESSTANHINALFKSARYWIYRGIGITGQAVVIGSYLDELITIFRNVLTEYPLEIIYIISELVGNTIIWLRRPGLNIFKWSVQSDFFFSGYCGSNDETVLSDTHSMQYLDLDWYFVVFLLLGLIPKNRNKYFKYYFNQKLLSALPGGYPLNSLLKT